MNGPDMLALEMADRIAAQKQYTAKLESEVARLSGALELAYGAMNYLGNVLNDMDASTKEDQAATALAFEKVRAALVNSSEGM